jgi:hypothetical protein
MALIQFACMISRNNSCNLGSRTWPRFCLRHSLGVTWLIIDLHFCTSYCLLKLTVDHAQHVCSAHDQISLIEHYIQLIIRPRKYIFNCAFHAQSRRIWFAAFRISSHCLSKYYCSTNNQILCLPDSVVVCCEVILFRAGNLSFRITDSLISLIVLLPLDFSWLPSFINFISFTSVNASSLFRLHKGHWATSYRS